MERCCSVFGHKKIIITNKLKERLKILFEYLIVFQNVTIFYFGGFGDFDELCWQIVSQLKQKYNNISRIYCLSDPKYLRISKRPDWLKNEDYEQVIYLGLKYDYWYTRIYFRNCEIIDRSDYIVLFVDHTENSGAFKAMKYALQKKKVVFNISDFRI